MPKSKRDKKISLTKVDKKGLALKQKIVENVRSCIEKYNSVYVFTHGNMRNNKMKEIREEWKPSYFFYGKNKVLRIGLGRTPEEEIKDDLHKVSQCLKYECGLLFTDCPKNEVVNWFNNFTYETHARTGFQVDRTIELKAGPLSQFPHSSEPFLRQLGLPTKLERGVVTLIKDYEVCKADSVLIPEQAKILELLDCKLAKLQLVLKACWVKGEGFEMLNKKHESEDEDMEDKAE